MNSNIKMISGFIKKYDIEFDKKKLSKEFIDLNDKIKNYSLFYLIAKNKTDVESEREYIKDNQQKILQKFCDEAWNKGINELRGKASNWATYSALGCLNLLFPGETDFKSIYTIFDNTTAYTKAYFNEMKNIADAGSDPTPSDEFANEIVNLYNSMSNYVLQNFYLNGFTLTVDQDHSLSSFFNKVSDFVDNINKNTTDDKLVDITNAFSMQITGLKLNKSELELNQGESSKLSLSISPENVEEKSVTWSSSNPEIVTVDNNGNINAVKEGTSTVTVSSNNDPTINDKCVITVKDPNRRKEVTNTNTQDNSKKQSSIENKTQNSSTKSKTEKRNKNNFETANVNNTHEPIKNIEKNIQNSLTTQSSANSTSTILDNNQMISRSNSKTKKQIKNTINMNKAIINKVTRIKNNKDLKGSSYNRLKLKTKKVEKTTMTISWNKVKSASSYLIFRGKPNKEYKYLASKNFTTYRDKKLRKGTFYKYLVIALNKNGKTLATSKVVLVTTKGNELKNPTSISVNKSKVKLKNGQTYSIVAKLNENKLIKYRKLSFESSNSKIATVSKKGKLKAKKRGTVTIYIYAQNGVSKKVKVLVG